MTIKTHLTHLTLDHLVLNRTLAHQLSPGVAFRYHALPIAKDNDHITVVMANPADKTARAAIANNLGVQPYVVKGDQMVIDRQLAEIWPDEVEKSSPNLLLYHQGNSVPKNIKTYAQQISSLLQGRLAHFQVEPSHTDFNELVKKASQGQDLVIFNEPEQSLLKRILAGPTACKAAEQLPTSVLVVRQPRWPLKKILLITRGYETDNKAVNWLVRLAQPSQAKVTVLALTPDSPVMYQRAATTMPHGLIDWLATDTPLGHQLRCITEQLSNWDIQGRLRFRQGSPCDQIQQENADSDYDLIVIAADPDDWWQRRLLGEVVNPLLHKADRPVLVAKSTVI